MNIKNATAFVTGANRGIGRAIVLELLAAGAAKVYAAARNTDNLTDLLETAGGRVTAVALDITKPDQIAAAALAHTDVTLLINNAGVAGFSGLIAAGDDSVARGEMETNYFGTLNMVRAFAPILATNGGGGVVNLASMASYVNFPMIGSYSASKAAVHSLTQGIRAELAAQGTQVAGVYPGPIDTDMTAEFPMDKTPTNVAAQAILAGVENGDEEIYPDPLAVEMHAGYLGDPKAVEKEAGGMLPG